MGERTLTRRFRAETGTSPLQWLQRLRLEHARDLLEASAFSTGRIAEVSGLGTADSLRQHFSRRYGIPQSAYRPTFRHGGRGLQSRADAPA